MLQIYFFCWNNIDLKYTSSVIHQVEVYLNYIWSMIQLCFRYTLEVYFQYIWSILKVHFTLVRDCCFNKSLFDNWKNPQEMLWKWLNLLDLKSRKLSCCKQICLDNACYMIGWLSRLPFICDRNHRFYWKLLLQHFDF